MWDEDAFPENTSLNTKVAKSLLKESYEDHSKSKKQILFVLKYLIFLQGCWLATFVMSSDQLYDYFMSRKSHKLQFVIASPLKDYTLKMQFSASRFLAAEDEIKYFLKC